MSQSHFWDPPHTSLCEPPQFIREHYCRNIPLAAVDYCIGAHKLILELNTNAILLIILRMEEIGIEINVINNCITTVIDWKGRSNVTTQIVIGIENHY